MNRRYMLKRFAVATAGIAALAGCLADDDTDDTDDTDSDTEDTFPDQSVEVVIPFGEGGGTDIFARTVGNEATDALGESIEFNNVTGAGGLNGSQQVFNSDSDGHTTLMFNPPSTPTSWLIQQPDFDIGQFKGVARFGQFPYLVYANADYEIESYQGLLDRFEDGEFTQIAGQGTGTVSDVIARTLRDEYDLGWDSYISYEGGGEVTQAVMSDEVTVGLGTDSSAESGVEEGRIEPIACLPSGGSAVLPELETLEEQGFAEEGDSIDIVAMLNVCMWAPPETPDDRIQVLTEAIEEAIDSEAVTEFGEESGNITEYGGPDVANDLLQSSLETIPEIVDIEAIREDT